MQSLEQFEADLKERMDRQDFPGAIEVAREGLKQTPGHFRFLKSQGDAHKALKQWDEAEGCYARLSEVAPDNYFAWFYRGVCRAEQRRYAEAVTHYLKALALRPDFEPALINIASQYMYLEQEDEALRYTELLLAQKPNSIEGYNALGLLHHRAGRYEQAIVAYEKAMSLDPERTEVIDNMGFALAALGRFAEAEAVFERGARLGDNHAAFCRSQILLLQGKWDEGTLAYECRFKDAQVVGRPFAYPYWQGEDISSKTLLVWGEQAIGEDLMFASLLPDLVPRAKKVILEVTPRLVELFQRSFPACEVIGQEKGPQPALARRSDIDCQVAMGSLMRWCKPRHDYALGAGYLIPDKALVKDLKERYAVLGPVKRVGISWVSQGTETSRMRSSRLEEWLPILKTPGVRFFNLQYGNHAEELAMLARSAGVEIVQDRTIDPLTDMNGFAAQMDAMDLVISCANSTVHMAGAMGVPVWVMVPFLPSWRYFMTREDCYWYPHATLFRQPNPERWDEVMTSVAAQLKKHSWAR